MTPDPRKSLITFDILAIVSVFPLILGTMDCARAQVYPLRPITMVVPFPPGGPLDTVARITAESMRATLGQPVIIENLAGAAGTLGVGRVARAAGDGYTLCAGFVGTHVINGATYTLQYDVLKDFQPISLIASNSWLIVAKGSMAANDLKDLIAWLKANPDKATQGTVGAGSPHHIAGVLFQKQTATTFQFVPYRGAAPAMQALVAGQIDMIIDSPTIVMPQVRAGHIKGYAVAAKSRLSTAPDIPTVDEAGLPGFYVSSWSGVWAPKGTPKEVIAKLSTAIANGLAGEAVRSRFADIGMQVFAREQQTPEALHAHQKAEIEKWWPIIREAGIKAE
jgi:tripartite-type tricarboxylate transporter receptor subunit TctC